MTNALLPAVYWVYASPVPSLFPIKELGLWAGKRNRRRPRIGSFSYKARRLKVSITELPLCFETGPRTEMGLHVIIPGEKKVPLEGPSRNGQSADEEK